MNRKTFKPLIFYDPYRKWHRKNDINISFARNNTDEIEFKEKLYYIFYIGFISS